MKGLVLAGGFGIRLYTIIKGVSQRLLPIYDNLMVRYPIKARMILSLDDNMTAHPKQLLILLPTWTSCSPGLSLKG